MSEHAPLERIDITRIVSTAEALDNATFAAAAIVMRIAPDEALVIGDNKITVDDPHAIIVNDTGWYGAWMAYDEAEPFLRRNCTWELPSDRPTLAQGRVADAPVKLWLEADRLLLLVPHVGAQNLAERMAL